LEEWLREGPFALGMSSGFFGFFAHCGVLTVLEDAGLVPSRVAGSSAGALVTGAWAAGLAASRLATELIALRREDFWDPRPGPGLLRGELFRARLDALLPAATFEDCRIPASVSVFDVMAGRVRALENGALAVALHASCAVPLLFHPVWIDGRPYVDGGVTDRPGLFGMPLDEPRVLFHHLASRSPWRRPGSVSMDVPSRPGMTSLVIADLPRVGPFRLPEGRRAFDAARRAMKTALGRTLEEPRLDGGRDAGRAVHV
jgi:NTE family protein